MLMIGSPLNAASRAFVVKATPGAWEGRDTDFALSMCPASSEEVGLSRFSTSSGLRSDEQKDVGTVFRSHRFQGYGID